MGKKILILAGTCVLMSSLLFGCSAAPVKESPNTSLVVTYEDKIVHRRNSKWVSREKLTQAADSKKEIFIIFGADWCKSCNLLRDAIDQANLDKEIYFLNIDEPWVAKLATMFKVSGIPTMFHVNSKSNIIAGRQGAGPSVVYLLTK